MISNDYKTTNYNASSVVEVEDAEITIMRMNAFVDKDNRITFNQEIPSTEIYTKYKTTADADFETWKNEVIADVNNA